MAKNPFDIDIEPKKEVNPFDIDVKKKDSTLESNLPKEASKSVGNLDVSVTSPYKNTLQEAKTALIRDPNAPIESSGEYIAKQGYYNSLIGLTNAIIDPKQYTVDQKKMKEYSPSLMEEAAAGVYGMVLDLPAFGVGGKIGGLVAKPIVNKIVQKTAENLIKTGVEKTVAKEIAKKGAAKTVENIASSDGALGTYDFAKDAMGQWADPDKKFEDIHWSESLKEGGKGYLLGLGIGGLGEVTGEVSKIAKNYLQGNENTVAQAGIKAAGFGAENATFLYGQKLLDQDKTPVTGKDWALSAMTLGALKIPHAKQMAKDFRTSENFEPTKSNKGEFEVEFTPDELKFMRKEKADDVIKDYDNKDNLAQLLIDKEVPAITKAKVLWSTKGIDINRTFEPDRIVSEQKGEDNVVSTYAKDGTLIDRTIADNKVNADSQSLELNSLLIDKKNKDKAANLLSDQKVEVLNKLKDDGLSINVLNSGLDKTPPERSPEESNTVNKYFKIVSEIDGTLDKKLKDQGRPDMPELILSPESESTLKDLDKAGVEQINKTTTELYDKLDELNKMTKDDNRKYSISKIETAKDIVSDQIKLATGKLEQLSEQFKSKEHAKNIEERHLKEEGGNKERLPEEENAKREASSEETSNVLEDGKEKSINGDVGQAEQPAEQRTMEGRSMETQPDINLTSDTSKKEVNATQKGIVEQSGVSEYSGATQRENVSENQKEVREGTSQQTSDSNRIVGKEEIENVPEKSGAPSILSPKEETSKSMKAVLGLENEPNIFTRTVSKEGKELGEVHIKEGDKDWQVKFVNVEEKGKGTGKEIYRELNKEAQREGKLLKSDDYGKMTKDATNLWESLVKSGEAKKTEAGYEMIPSLKETGIKHALTAETRRELGIEDYQKETTTNKELQDKAEAEIKSGYNIEKLLSDIENDENKLPSALEQTILKTYLSGLKERIGEDPTESQLIELKRVINISDKAGSNIAKSLASRRGSVIQEDSMADFFIREMEAVGVDKLTDKQKETVVKEFNEISEANKIYEEKLKRLEEENAILKSRTSFDNLKKSTTRNIRKTHQDYTSERDQLRKNIAEKWKLAAKDNTLSALPLPYAKQLAYITPDVLKLTKSYIEEGVINLKDVVSNIHNDIKDYIPGITEVDIHNMIAGEYKEPRKTKTEKVSILKDLREEARLINKLEKLQSGTEPKQERQKIERNKQITDLRNQIKSFKKEQGDAGLKSIKSRVENEIKKLEQDLRTGNYAKEEKKIPIMEDKEVQKRFPELYKETLEAKDKRIKLKQEREIRLLKEKYANRTRLEKTGDAIIEVISVPRSLMASMDLSAVFRQGLIPTISHPKMASKAFSEMLKQAVSEKRFDRWLNDLYESPDYHIIKESGLYVADLKNPKLSAKEEQFMNNLAEKIPGIGKLIKGSERAYMAYLNKMRVDMFRRMASAYEADGKNINNSKELYKQTAKLINSETGRGNVGQFEEASKVLNTLFFSPRLIASRLNLLTNPINPNFYTKVPKEVRIEYFKDMAKFITAGTTVLALSKLAGAQVEDDPRSSDFGKIRIGNLRYDIWGGFQQYIRLASQLLTGQTKSTTTGEIKQLGTGYGERTRLSTAMNFLRGKLAPVPATATNLLAGKNVVGEDVTLTDELLKTMYPIWVGDAASAVKDQNIYAALYVTIPNIMGIGTQMYEPKEAKLSNRDFLKEIPQEKSDEFTSMLSKIDKTNREVNNVLKEKGEDEAKKFLKEGDNKADHKYYTANSKQLNKLEKVVSLLSENKDLQTPRNKKMIEVEISKANKSYKIKGTYMTSDWVNELYSKYKLSKKEEQIERKQFNK